MLHLLLAIAVGCFFTSTTLAADPTQYTVGVGDVLHVEVYGEPDLSGDLTVSQGCELTFALIGRLPVCGLSTTDIEALAASHYAHDYLVSPTVAVSVLEYRSHKVDVLGQVEKSGPVYLRGPTTLLELLSLAGGPKGENVVDIELIKRDGSSHDYKLPKLAASGQDIFVDAGDTVRVKPGEVVYLEGEVAKPGTVGLADGLTVTRALAVAGGPTTYANLRRVLVRHPDGSKVRVNVVRIHRGVAEDTLLMADDHVLVPSGPF